MQKASALVVPSIILHEKIMAIAIFELIRHSTLIADDAQTYMIANIVFVLMVDTRALSMIRRPISTSKNNEDE